MTESERSFIFWADEDMSGLLVPLAETAASGIKKKKS